MKKSLLTLATLFLAVGLVACDGSKDSASTSGKPSAPQGSTSAAPITLDVPADKTAYVMKVKEGSIELSSYNSVFLTGNMTGWATGLDAIEMKSGVLDGYLVGYAPKYVPAEGDEKPFEYQLVVGYNTTAEIGDDMKGLVFNDDYKSEECAGYAYPTNPAFTYDAEKRIADLGEHKFVSQPGAPDAPLTNFKVKVSFTESVPEYVVPHFLGSYNKWNTQYTAELELATRMTVVPETDRKTWTFTLAEVYAGKVEWNISLDYTLEAKPDQVGFSWNKPVETDDDHGNGEFTVMQIMGNDYVMELNPKVLTFDFATKLPDPASVKKANLKIVVTTTGDAVADDKVLCVTGNFTGWKASQMTASADRKTFTLELTDFEASKLQFGITLGNADGTADWSHCVKAASGNIEYDFTATENTVVTIVADLAAAFNAGNVEQAYTSIESTPWVA